MNLGARILSSVGGVNDFDPATEVQAMKGDAFDVYLQLIDKEQHKASQGFYPEGLRYIPASGATLQVTVLSIVPTKQFVRVATAPFTATPSDTSIWKFSILATDPVEGTVSLQLTLTEGAVVRTVYMQAVIKIRGIQESC
jgi:hypothetical protein